jgi:hypothetical protein
VATNLFLDRQTGRIDLEEVEQTFMSYESAIERILGAPNGSIHLIDRSVLSAWFG